MRFNKGDKKVVEAFLDKQPAESRKLSTDGKRLDGLWMGGMGIAEWKHGKIVFTDLGSKAAQTVQRAIVRAAPKNWLGEFGGLTTRPDGRIFPEYEGETLAWDINLYMTPKERRSGYPRARAVIEAMQAERPEQLERERREMLKASFDRMFGHNAKQVLDLIEETTGVGGSLGGQFDKIQADPGPRGVVRKYVELVLKRDDLSHTQAVHRARGREDLARTLEREVGHYDAAIMNFQREEPAMGPRQFDEANNLLARIRRGARVRWK